MKFTVLPYRPAGVGRMIIFLCIVFGLLAANLAAAQGEKYTRLTVPLGDQTNIYSEFATILPSNVNSEKYEQKTLNYTGGKDIKTSILLNGSMVTIFLLYPCQPPEFLLDADGLKALLATADKSIMQANYSETELNIDGTSAIWGVLGRSLFAAYQPTNQTAALIVMESSLDEETGYDLLYNMTITVNEGLTPITPGYCPDTTAVADERASIPADATDSIEASLDEVAAEVTSSSTEATGTETVTENVAEPTKSKKNKAEEDRAAAMALLEKIKGR